MNQGDDGSERDETDEGNCREDISTESRRVTSHKELRCYIQQSRSHKLRLGTDDKGGFDR